jgi:hypothetical protein
VGKPSLIPVVWVAALDSHVKSVPTPVFWQVPVWQATLGGALGGALALAAFAYVAVSDNRFPWKDCGPAKYLMQVLLAVILGAGAGWLIVGEFPSWAGGCIVGLTGPVTIRQVMKAFGDSGRDGDA